jgi:hypothetical protein
MAVAESLGRRVAERGGAALVIDYGQVGGEGRRGGMRCRVLGRWGKPRQCVTNEFFVSVLCLTPGSNPSLSSEQPACLPIRHPQPLTAVPLPPPLPSAAVSAPASCLLTLPCHAPSLLLIFPYTRLAKPCPHITSPLLSRPVLPLPQDGPYTSSLQAIRRHQFVSLLEQPGTADLSNRVDYSALR